jgi:tetratricopeptide (TPR) repeat protein
MDTKRLMQSAVGYFQAGDLASAGDVCRKILRKQPKNSHVLHFLGILYYQNRDYDAAINALKKSLHINPSDAEAWYNIGRAYEGKELIEEAIQSYKSTLRIKPSFVDAYINLGNLLQKNGQPDEAIFHYQRAAELNPGHAGVFYNLGVMFQEMDRLDEAISAFQRAIRLNPRYEDAYHDLGYVFHLKRQPMEAIASYRKAIEINRYMFDAYNNLGRVYQELGQIDDAVSYYRKSLEINPDFVEAHCNLAMALLLTGHYTEGWTEYEWRRRLQDRSRYEFVQPVWDGSDISGKTIFLYAEQGFGDTIQFVRFAPLVAERGARVIIECQKELKSLIQQVRGVHSVVTREDTLPEFDLHCPLLSLPLVFNTTPENIPAKIPYVAPNTIMLQKWSDEVKNDHARLKAGIVWSGNPKYKADQFRSIPLESFLQLWKIAGIGYYSLQKGEASSQVKKLSEKFKLIDYADEIQDFSDTAALIKNLDLVICVDTAVAHLAGALGKPVWTLLPFNPDWRWMLNREDSPWYPTMRLFRQLSPGDWGSVMDNVEKELWKIMMQKDMVNQI